MKILRLDLRAFGPFSDRVLQPDAGKEGLHIIYGPNEAGKSSALRALRQMLFGIPARSSDDFIHPYGKMRIGGTLQKKDGSTLSFIRRKGRANTLRDAEDEKPLDEALLLSFLGGADENLFTLMFGIDHPALVQGGEEIIRGGGNIGQILFSAGSGISGFRTVQSDLQAEADSLFKPAGQKPRINEGISEFRKTQKRIREVQLSAQEWDLHYKARVKAEKEKEKCETALAEKMRERNRLERFAEALPVISRRAELMDAYRDLAHALLLPEDFAQKRYRAFADLRMAENAETQAQAHLAELLGTLETLSVPEDIIAQAVAIHALNQQTGNVRKIVRERGQLEPKHSDVLSDAHEILRNLRKDMTLEEAEALRPEKKDVIRIREMGLVYEKLKTRGEHIAEELEKRKGNLERIKRRLHQEYADSPPEEEKVYNTVLLREIIEDVRAHGDSESRLASLEEEIRKAEKEAEKSLKKLPLWQGRAEELEMLPLPLPESTDIFENRLKAAEDHLFRLRKEGEAAQGKIAENESLIQELQLGGEVPTEKDLRIARETRDSIWEKIRGNLEKGADRLPEPEETDAYEKQVRSADETGDRLRREADRVARKAGLLADLEKEKARLCDLQEKNQKAEEELTCLQQEWKELWKESGISPLTPREMRAWMQKQSSLAAQLRELRMQKEAAVQLAALVENCRKELHRGLEKIGESADETESLSLLIRHALQIAEHLETKERQQEKLLAEHSEKESELAETRRSVEHLEEQWAQWRQDWAGALLPLGLDAHAEPAQAQAMLEDLQSLFAKIKEAGMLEQRIRVIARDTESFDENVAALLSRTAPDLENMPPEQAVSELSERLNRALEVRSEEQGLKKQILREEERLQKAGEEKNRVHALLRSMCETAGCEDYAQLPAAEEASEKRRQVEKSLEESRVQLEKLSAGMAVEDFVRDARSIDPDSIPPRIGQLTEEIRELDAEKSRLDQSIGKEKNELNRKDGDAKAAELAEYGQSILAGIERDAEHYVRIRLAFRILSHAIERYREKNQGPILKRSAELFSRMTLGSFAGLRTEFNDKNEAVLAGLRPGGQESVAVEGMSEGTADQLYLALRLAALEIRMEKNEPLPFIADDILIQFDDERAMATLEVLAGLSLKTQVIFFTHHRHLLELAEKHLDGNVLFIHHLK